MFDPDKKADGVDEEGPTKVNMRALTPNSPIHTAATEPAFRVPKLLVPIQADEEDVVDAEEEGEPSGQTVFTERTDNNWL